MCSCKARAWGLSSNKWTYPIFNDVCAEEAVGWKITAGSMSKETKVECYGAPPATTQAPVTAGPTRPPVTAGPVQPTVGPTNPPPPQPQFGAQVQGGGMDITGISRNNDFWSFSPKPGPDMDISHSAKKKFPIMIMFDNLTPDEKEIVKKPWIYYFKEYASETNGDLSCMVDRFEDYPVDAPIDAPIHA